MMSKHCKKEEKLCGGIAISVCWIIIDFVLGKEGSSRKEIRTPVFNICQSPHI